VAGAPLIDMQLSQGGHLTDHLHRTGFTLFGFGAAASEVQALAAACAPAAASWTLQAVSVVDATVARAYGAVPSAVYLVRPDGHVAARWREPTSAQLQLALRTACKR
jgi:3-(3-hydroxy-phenyl)propionate hydroxylase